jgi:purine-binding chemotaxis protein CheW
MPSLDDEQKKLVELFLKRKQDHLAWVTELKASVIENRRFALTTDPHKCAFGKWYDAYDPPDAVLAVKLLAFDQPHASIHAVGNRVIELMAEKRRDQALALIEATSTNELQVLLRLFDDTLPLLGDIYREVIVVVELDNRQVGIAVDFVKGVRHVPPERIESAESLQLFPQDNGILLGIAKVETSTQMLLNIETILS